MTAIKWARLFGGSLAVMLINDGRGLDEPLDWRHIQSIDDIRVFDRSVIQPDYTTLFNYDPRDPFSTRGAASACRSITRSSASTGALQSMTAGASFFKTVSCPRTPRIPSTSSGAYQNTFACTGPSGTLRWPTGAPLKCLTALIQPIYKMQNLAAELPQKRGRARCCGASRLLIWPVGF